MGGGSQNNVEPSHTIAISPVSKTCQSSLPPTVNKVGPLGKACSPLTAWLPDAAEGAKQGPGEGPTSQCTRTGCWVSGAHLCLSRGLQSFVQSFNILLFTFTVFWFVIWICFLNLQMGNSYSKDIKVTGMPLWGLIHTLILSLPPTVINRIFFLSI